MLTVKGIDPALLGEFTGRFGLELRIVADGRPIPGSYWGAPEAGLIGNALYAQPATPLHSLLHELAHFRCMGAERRQTLDTDAGGDDIEESAVCYLQILMADSMPGYGRTEIVRDMNDWGYSFRLGDAGLWFETDAADARDWLAEREIVSATDAA